MRGHEGAVALSKEAFVELLVAVKPSLEGQALRDEDHLMNDLGLDSLDLVQLARKLRKATGVPFAIDSWAAGERARVGQPRFTVGNLFGAVTSPAA